MATAAERALFIEEIAPCAQEAFKQLGKVKPSVCIGMACCESNYGTSKIMREHNAFFGQKCGTGKTATKFWSGTFFVSKTKEEYKVGQHTVIRDAFRSYPSMLRCCLNFYELLNTKLYARVEAGADYKKQMQQIKACGYMTSSTEVNTVLSIIKQYNLTKYDFDKKDAGELKSLDEIAQEVIAGKWGVGTQRRQALRAAGYNPQIVQARVNEILKSK